MSIPLVINSVTYNYPSPGDKDRWGTDATAWAQAITAQTLKQEGGEFTLLADVDFGETFGLLSSYFSSRSEIPASLGIIRLANLEGIAWRNAADDGNLVLSVDGDDKLMFNGVEVVYTAPTYATSVALQTDGSGNVEASGVTATELGYLSGATSNIQEQLNGMGSSDYVDPLTTDGDLLVRDGGATTRLPLGDEGQILAVESGAVVWKDASTSTKPDLGIEIDNLSWVPGSLWKPATSTATFTKINEFGSKSFDVDYAGDYILKTSGMMIMPSGFFRIALDVDGAYNGSNPEVLYEILGIANTHAGAIQLEDCFLVSFVSSGTHTIELYYIYNTVAAPSVGFPTTGGLDIQVIKCYDHDDEATWPIHRVSGNVTITNNSDSTGHRATVAFSKRGLMQVCARPNETSTPEAQRYYSGNTFGAKNVVTQPPLFYSYHNATATSQYTKTSWPLVYESPLDMLDTSLTIQGIDGRAYNHNSAPSSYTFLGLPAKISRLVDEYPIHFLPLYTAAVVVTNDSYVAAALDSTAHKWPKFFAQQGTYLAAIQYTSTPAVFADDTTCYTQAKVKFNATEVEFPRYVHGAATTAGNGWGCVAGTITRYAVVTLSANTEYEVTVEFRGSTGLQQTSVNRIGTRVILIPIK